MQKISSKKHAYQYWYRFLIKYKFIYILGVFTVLLTAISQVLTTRAIGWIIDFFTLGKSNNLFNSLPEKDHFLALFYILLFTRVTLFIGRIGWRLTLGRQTHRSSGVLKREIWKHVKFFKKIDLQSKYSKGILMSASTSDVNQGRFVYGFTLIAIIDVIFLGLFTIISMVVISPKLTLYSFLSIILFPMAISKLSSAESDRYRIAQEHLGDFNDLSSQVVGSIRLQRVTQTGNYWKDRLFHFAKNYREKRLKATYTSLLFYPVMGSSSLATKIVIFGFGIVEVFNGSISLGDFIALQGLVSLLQDPLFELGFIISDWKKGFTSLERLSDIFLNQKDENILNKNSLSVDQDSKEEIIIEGTELGYRFEESEQNLFTNLNIKLNKGDRLGIYGPIGSGKSTLVDVLAGLDRNHQGAVKFKGNNFSEYSHDVLRSYIGRIPQKPFLFADTIRSNIKLDLDLTDDQIWECLKISGLDEDVNSFDKKLDTPLGEWGINLSGGQKQRLTLARAIAREPKLLFLDDCLSAVDTVTEEKILKNLDHKLKDTTLVWVAHRKSTLKYCNQFLELS